MLGPGERGVSAAPEKGREETTQDRTHPRPRSEGEGRGGVLEGRDKALSQEAGAGSSPAGGDALAAFLTVRPGDAKPCDQPAADVQTRSPRAKLRAPKSR